MKNNTRQVSPQTFLSFAGYMLSRYAWFSIPFFIMAMAALWIMDPRIAWHPPVLGWIVHYGASALGIVFIVIVAGRSFLINGQPSVLMLGCAVLITAIGAAAMQAAFARGTSTGFAIYNTSALLSALCHFTGVAITTRLRIRLRHSAVWLTAAYAGGTAVMGLVIWLALTGRFPVFFIDDQGGTLPRTLVVSASAALFLLTAGMLWQANRLKASSFLHWYALGLVLVATGLTGSLAIFVRDSPLQWITRFTQVFGLVFICIAVMTSARENSGKGVQMTPMEQAWRRNEFLSGLRKQTPLKWVLKYGLAIGAVAAAMGLRLVLSAGVDTGLPTFITFYPAVLVAALAGFGPGLAATLLSSWVVGYYIMPPVGQLFIASSIDRLSLVIFFGMGLFISTVTELSRRYREKIAAYESDLSLREKQERLAVFAEASFEGIVESKAGRIVDCNEQFAQLSGYPVAELMGMKIADLIAPEDLDRVTADIRQVWESVTEHAIIRKDGMRILVETHGRSVSLDRRHTAIRDITEQKLREEKLQKLNRTLLALTHGNEVMMRATDESAFIGEICNIIRKDCGYTMVWIGYAENDDAKSVRPVASCGFDAGYLESLDITWADTERGRGPTGTAIRTGRMSTCRNMLIDPQFAPWREEALKRGYASSLVLPLMADGQCFGAITIYSRAPDPFTEDEVILLTELADDLAFGIMSLRLRIEHTRADAQIKASLAEKEVLLKEIHHRVKNNMQVISSLISLQADSLADEKLQGELGDVRDRVRTMALVHEKLYQTEDLARIDFAEYAPSLLNYLWSAHGASMRNIRLNMSLAPLILQVDMAVNCGLILNELAGNSIKHAFPDGSGGEVSVVLEHDPATGAVCLQVRDNGVGLPVDPDWRQSSSLGLRLVQMLAGQLHGTVQTITGQDPGPGTEFQIRFVLKEIPS